MTEDSYDYTTPISTAFEMQRTAVEQSREAIERSVDVQREFNETMLDSVDAGAAESGHEAVEVARRSMLAYLDAVETTVPGSTDTVEELRRAIDEGFDDLLEAQDEAVGAAEEGVERSVESYDEFADEYLAALDQQFDALLAAHEDVEATSVETLEDALEQYERVQREFDAEAGEFAEAFESRTEEFAEAFEAQLEQFREEFEELQARIDELQPPGTDGAEA